MNKKILTIVAMGILFFSLGSAALAQNEKTEASIIINSGKDLSLIIKTVKARQSAKAQKYVMQNYTEPIIKGIKISTQQKYAINNFIVYGTISNINLAYTDRAGVIKDYKNKTKKLPITEKDWNKVLEMAKVINSKISSSQLKYYSKDYKIEFSYNKNWNVYDKNVQKIVLGGINITTLKYEEIIKDGKPLGFKINRYGTKASSTRLIENDYSRFKKMKLNNELSADTKKIEDKIFIDGIEMSRLSLTNAKLTDNTGAVIKGNTVAYYFIYDNHLFDMEYYCLDSEKQKIPDFESLINHLKFK